jgi:transcriptional regulator with XRE-family HTH domain
VYRAADTGTVSAMRTDKTETEAVSPLRRIREEKQMTQLALAIATGVSIGYVAMLDRGLPPSMKTARKLAAALGCKAEDLLPEAR